MAFASRSDFIADISELANRTETKPGHLGFIGAATKGFRKELLLCIAVLLPSGGIFCFPVALSIERANRLNTREDTKSQRRQDANDFVIAWIPVECSFRSCRFECRRGYERDIKSASYLGRKRKVYGWYIAARLLAFV